MATCMASAVADPNGCRYVPSTAACCLTLAKKHALMVVLTLNFAWEELDGHPCTGQRVRQRTCRVASVLLRSIQRAA